MLPETSRVFSFSSEPPRAEEGRMNRVNWSVALWMLVAISIPQQRAAAQLETHSLNHNGYSRPYLIYKPAHLPAHPAAVVMLGGIRSTAISAAKDYGWTEAADKNSFLVVFPDPVATQPDRPIDGKTNVTFWEMAGSRTHVLVPGALAVDDDGYLTAVLHDVLQREQLDRHRIFFAGFSSGSGMVQLFASRHSRDVAAIAAVATPLMHPPTSLLRPMPVLYIHGDEDEQFSGFEVNSPDFATTPHGNWVTWGYLDGCHVQTARKTDWGVQFSWTGCKNNVPVIADLVAGLGHEWSGGLDSKQDKILPSGERLKFTDMAWKFFSAVRTK
jgi:polyhydroxybutyrate depolymerase